MTTAEQTKAEKAPTPVVGTLPPAVTNLLTAVLEALDLPHPAIVSGTEAHDRLLNTRAMHARLAIRSALEEGPLGIDWTANYLRERLAKHPIAGYVTVDQAHAAMAAGKSWSEAVALPAGEKQ
ncbi:hypothetical protein ACQ86D_26325 [Streptomyces galilaeus]